MSLRPAGFFHALDVVTRVAPVGLRLWDVHAGRPADDTVRVGLLDGTARAAVAVRTPSGVHTLRGLPGLGESERGVGDGPYWYHPPVEGSFRVGIRDLGSTYLPMDLDVRLPTHGLYRPACTFPELDAPVVPVFSSCARPAPSGFAVVRAQLATQSGGPASWARLDVVLPDGSLARGVADGEGRVVVLFSYPEPPADMTGALADTTWTLDLHACFGVGAPRRPVAAREAVPELCDVLGQRPARLVGDGDTELTQTSLSFGRERVLCTAGRSTLLITDP